MREPPCVRAGVPVRVGRVTGLGVAGGIERTRRACLALARAARAHRLYASNNVTLQRMLDELDAAFQDMLAHESLVSITVRRTAFEIDDVEIFVEDNLDESLPYAFYRDGIRQLAFRRGLLRTELNGLLNATAQRLNFSGLGEDIVSLLWRLDLEHIDYVVVDTTLTRIEDNSDAPVGTSSGVGQSPRLATVLTALFGTGGKDMPLSMHLDAYDVPAKAIADALGAPDEMAPGLHPSTGLDTPKYANDVLNEVAEEGETAIAIRGLEGALRSLAMPLPEPELKALSDALIRMLDTAILENQFLVAARLVHGMRSVPQPRERVAVWMDQVVAEARIRHVGARYATKLPDDERAQIVMFFRACGGWAIGPLLQLLPSISDAGNRRSLSDLVLEFGIADVDQLRPLIASEQAFVVQEAVYMLSRINSESSIALLREMRQHPLPQVRASIAESASSLPRDISADITADLLDDPDPRVRSIAARTLAKKPSKTTQLLLENAVQKSRLEGTTTEVKRAMLEAYATVAQERAVQPIARFIREGEGLFPSREQEDFAVAAAWALARIRSVTAVEILKRACASRHRRVKQSAREALMWMKENA